MPQPRVIDAPECERLLRAGDLGRVGVSTPEGPHILAVDYTVLEDTIVLRTSSYSVLGSYGPEAMLAFEVGGLDPARGRWSVLARGRGRVVRDPEELARVREAWRSRPWTSRARALFLRIRWSSLTGHRLAAPAEAGHESPIPRTLTAS